MMVIWLVLKRIQVAGTRGGRGGAVKDITVDGWHRLYGRMSDPDLT